MKNKHKAILLSSLVLVLLLPLTSLAEAFGTDASARSAFVERTTVRGFVLPLGMDKTGQITHVFAIRMHFFTLTASGQHNRGVVRMRFVDIPTKVTGYRGVVYISASFWGSLNL